MGNMKWQSVLTWQNALVEGRRDLPAMAKHTGIVYLIRFKNGKAVAFMKQARCNALYVAKTRTPDKFAGVQARWEGEWKEFEAWHRTQGPLASSYEQTSAEYERKIGKERGWATGLN